MSDELEALLKSQKCGIVFIPNGGNAGDSFIAHATYQLLTRLGVSYELGALTREYRGRTIVCGGGGNLIDAYGEMAQFIRRNYATCRELIILPHTICAYGDVISEMKSNCFLFCREQPSFDFVKRHATAANVYIADDMALGWRPKDTVRAFRWASLLGLPTPFDWCLSRIKLHRNCRWATEQVLEQKTWDGILNAFRTDVEKTDVALPADNFDVSARFTYKRMEPKPVLLTSLRMMRFLSQFDLVRTNRLHVAIMSAILGLSVEFFDNSYGKNSSVYEHSMRDRFENVRWMGGTSVAKCA